MRVLVTGGAGFLGTHLCEGLLEKGIEVRAVDNLDSGRKENLEVLRQGVEFYHGSTDDESLLKKAARGVDAVIHTAFPMVLRRQGTLNPAAAAEAIRSLLKVARACLAENALLVYLSSIAVYGNQQYTPIDEAHPTRPVTLYGATKLAEEIYCRMLSDTQGLKMTILRVSDIYGPRNSRVSLPIHFLLQVLKGQPLVVHGDGSQSRTYTYVSDLVKAVLLALERNKAVGEIFNISGDRCISVRELAAQVIRVTGSGVGILVDPGAETDTRRLWIDNRKAREVLGFRPEVNLEEGLRRTYDWLRRNPDYYGS
ncbi:NAD-dependent epimerase/dehydratase family protein [Calderihabitans maritimus]|uniref:Nucleoside-diphosphate-sugar epimerases n=1 Tax=Calderihabitans maritimus TaxID=1246530 RepID=A0A1Z5HV65_9FIRM|nr:NAD-dependent epimerase/dehydratase family protein [Calderihabitans maritimus]GAW93298.1 nucleoside-diphosphate-sugar epimerases [Calderihabitans maritimus]